jgi:WD40 repeat protein
MQAQTLTSINTTAQVYGLTVSPLNSGYLVVSMVNILSLYNSTDFSLILKVNTLQTFYGMDSLIPSGSVIMAGFKLVIYTIPYGILSYNYTLNALVWKVKLLPDNLTVVCGYSNGSLMLFNSGSNAVGSLISAHSNKLTLLTLTPDLGYLVSGSMDTTIIMWQWSTMSLTQVKQFSVTGSMYAGVIIASTYTSSNIIFFNHLV